MTWHAPAPPADVDGPLTGPDRPILEGFLAWQRRTLLDLCSGLTGEQLATRVLQPSGLSLLGLLRHMAKVERTWFRQRVAGILLAPMFDPGRGKDVDFDELDPASAATDYARYVEECRLADEAVAHLDFDTTFLHAGQPHSLRLVYVHMIAEYARHNGHADLLREHLDGRTGV